jgi:hypothetical protein
MGVVMGDKDTDNGQIEKIWKHIAVLSKENSDLQLQVLELARLLMLHMKNEKESHKQ